MDLFKEIEKRSKPVNIAVGIVLVMGIGLADYLTGYELAFSLFYLIPIGLVAWFNSKRTGILAAVLSAAIWLAADIEAGQFYEHPAVYVWNALIRFSFFLIIVLLLSALRNSFEHEKELARTDWLTEAVNSRYFLDLLKNEINRSQRYNHPFTLVYLDVDDLKTVNDQFGHAAGDELLRRMVHQVRSSLRRSDVMARLGGDEFAILLPEIGQESVQAVIAKIQRSLPETMDQTNRRVTCSIGALTCAGHLFSPVDRIISLADELMYTVKGNGKNSVAYSVLQGASFVEAQSQWRLKDDKDPSKEGKGKS